MNRPAAPPRYSLVVTIALLVLFYPLFVFSNAQMMRVNLARPEVLTATQELPQGDFGLFWCAGKELAAKAAQHFGLAGPDRRYNSICRIDILADDAPQRKAWPYPPPAGFLVMLLAALPLPLGFWVWRLSSLVFGGWLLRRAGLGWPAIVAGLASPAAMHDMAGGQNGTLTGAMLVAALLLAPRRPCAAGVLAGFLTLKPQLGLVFPAIIWRRGGLRLVLAGACTALLLVAASLLVWGTAQWAWFLRVAEPDEIRSAADLVTPYGITVYAMVISLGGTPHLAWTVQWLAAITAFLATAAAWREGVMQPLPRLALTVSLGLLMMPHAFCYDLVAYSLGLAALFFRAGLQARPALALLWLMGGYTVTISNYSGVLLFPLWALCSATLAWWLRHQV